MTYSFACASNIIIDWRYLITVLKCNNKINIINKTDYLYEQKKM